MWCPLNQSSDDSSQCEQTLVNVTGLPCSFVYSARPTNVFATSKINLQHKDISHTYIFFMQS